jgi:hypothetical protein
MHFEFWPSTGPGQSFIPGYALHSGVDHIPSNQHAVIAR